MFGHIRALLFHRLRPGRVLSDVRKLRAHRLAVRNRVKNHRHVLVLRVAFICALLIIPGILAINFLNPSTASATAGIEQEMSFEGKVVTSAGLNIPDGNYNMEFKIYTGCTNEPTSNTGCTAVWTEDYLTSNSTYSTTTPVAFTSGTFQADLGSICSFSGGSCEGNTNTAINWDTYPLYLSLNVGTTSACATGFTSCGGGDGAMSPYVLLTSSPYALNANNSNELGGVASTGYIQTTPGASQTIQPSANATGLVVEQNSGGTYGADIFDVQGTGGGADNFIQVTDSAANTGNVNIAGIGSSSTVGIQSGSGGTISVGTAAVAQTVDIGNTSGASAVSIQGGSGGIDIGTAATGQSITLGNTTGMTVTINTTGEADTINGATDVIKSSTNANNAFEVESSGNSTVLDADTSADEVDVGTGTVASNIALNVGGAIEQGGLTTSNTSSTFSGEWTELGQCDITAQFGECMTNLDIISGYGGGSLDPTASVTARVKQQNALGGTPVIEVTLGGNMETIAQSNIVAVTTQNNTSATIVQLWGQISDGFEQWIYTPILDSDGSDGGATVWTWTPSSGFSASLPGGTDTAAAYSDQYANTFTVQGSTNSTSALQVQNTSGYNILNVNSGTTTATSGTITLGNVTTTGGAGVAGSIVLADGSADGFGATLNTTTLTGNQTITLPNASGTLCLSNGNCSAAGGYIINGTSTQSSSNFNISGTGTAQTSFLTPTVDALTSGATIAIGGTNAATVTVGAAGGSNNTTTVDINNSTGSGTQDVNIGSSFDANNAVAIHGGTGASAITLQAGSSGSIDIASNAVAQTVNIGNTTGASAVLIQSGTGNLQLTTQGTGTLGIGNNAVAQTLAIGNSTGGTSVSVQSGTAGINIGTAGIANTITVGNSSGAVAQTIAIGTNATSGATNTINIGAATASTSNINVAGATVDFNATHTDVGSTSLCTSGKFCVAQNDATPGGGTSSTSSFNLSEITGTSTGSNTLIGQSYTLQDTSTGGTNTLQGITITSTATTNAGTAIDSIVANTLVAASGYLLQLQGGGTNEFTVGNNGGTTITPAGSSTVGLTVNGTPGATPANSVDINQGYGAAGLVIASTNNDATYGLDLTGTYATDAIASTNFTLTSAGALTAVGVNSGTGLLQGTGGLTLTGTTQINASGTGATTIGNTSDTSAVSIQDGSGGINIGTGGVANTITVGNTSGAVAQTIDIGTNATASSTTTLALGSTIGTSTSTLQADGISDVLTGSTTAPSDIIKSGTNSATAFEIQNASSEPIFLVNTTTSNDITNPGFEVNTTGWASSGTGASIARNTTLTHVYQGQASLAVTLGTGAGTGTLVNSFSPATINGDPYEFSFFAEGSAALTGLAATVAGGGAPTCTLNGTTVGASGFQEYYCNFTPTGAITSITVTVTTASQTLYIDSAQLVQSATLQPYEIGTIQMRGVITNPQVYQATSNSTTAFQVQNAAGVDVLNIDTTDGRVGINNIAPAYPLDVAGDINTSTTYSIAGNVVLQTPGTGNIFVGEAGNNTFSTADYNYAVGTGALNDISTGAFNVALGGNALFADTGGGGNVAVGVNALQDNAGGTNSVGIGQNAGAYITTNTANTLIGYAVLGGTGLTGSTDADNTIIGNNNLSFNNLTGSNNNIVVGYNNLVNAATTTASGDIIIGNSISPATANVANLLDIGNAYYGNTNVGSAYIQPITDSATTFQVLDSAGTAAALTVSTSTTTDQDVIIGSGVTGEAKPTLLSLDNGTTATDPTGVTGAMYWNTVLQEYRCYNGTVWEACQTDPITSGWNVQDEFMSGGTTAGTIGTLGWNAVGTGGAYAYDQNGTGAYNLVDRPGLLRLQSTASTATDGAEIFLAGSGTADPSAFMEVGEQIDASASMWASDVSADDISIIGLDNYADTATLPTNGVYWQADQNVSADWEYCYDGTCTASTWGVNANLSNMMEFQIHINTLGTGTSSVTYTIGTSTTAETSYTVNAVTIDSATAPTKGVFPEYACYQRVADTGGASCDINYYQFSGVAENAPVAGSTPR